MTLSSACEPLPKVTWLIRDVLKITAQNFDLGVNMWLYFTVNLAPVNWEQGRAWLDLIPELWLKMLG